MTDARSSQLPLDLGRNSGQSRDELVMALANRAAIDLIDRWPGWPAPVVVLAGPAGSGKSHIARVWADVSGAVEADASNIDQSLFGRAASGTPLLIDGVGQGVDETGLFHLINAVRQGGGQLLLTSRLFPAAWGVSLQDLQSRLRAATIVEIAEPDDFLLSAVMTKLFSDRQVKVEPHVIGYIANRIERSLSTAMSVVDRLDAAALARGARISRALAAEVIGALDEGQSELDI
ncbi:MAG: DnaA regulatory inactivator HdaA [Mesorhizobium sp.]